MLRCISSRTMFVLQQGNPASFHSELVRRCIISVRPTYAMRRRNALLRDFELTLYRMSVRSIVQRNATSASRLHFKPYAWLPTVRDATL